VIGNVKQYKNMVYDIMLYTKCILFNYFFLLLYDDEEVLLRFPRPTNNRVIVIITEYNIVLQ